MQPQTKTVIDLQDPLPENNFLWRRVFTFVVTAIVLAFIWYALEFLHDLGASQSVYHLARLLVFLVGLLVTLYMVAPSAEQMVKLVQAARLLRVGVERGVQNTPSPGSTPPAQTPRTGGVVTKPPAPRKPGLPDEADWK